MRVPRMAATWRCCSGRARTTARGTRDLRRRRGRRPPGGAAVGARERLPVERGLAPRRGGGHLEVLQWARANGCSVGREDLRLCREWRPPGGAAVGARERRSVGRVDLRRAAEWRPPGGAAVGARERLPVGRVDLRRAAAAATWRCCSGRARTAAPWDEKTCADAAEGGHLEVLQWARANGCPWSEGTWSSLRERWSGLLESSALEGEQKERVREWFEANVGPQHEDNVL